MTLELLHVEAFAEAIRSLLERTVSADAGVEIIEDGNGALLAPPATAADRRGLRLAVSGVHYLDLDFAFRLRRSSTDGLYVLETSNIALSFARNREPLVRFDYVRSRSWGAGHVQVHAESSALGYLFAVGGRPPPPRTRAQELHLPAGPGTGASLADVIEFAVHDLAVDAQEDWLHHVHRFRQEDELARLRQLIRHRIRAHPSTGAADVHGLVAAVEHER